MTTTTLQQKKPFLFRTLIWKITLAHVLLLGILALSAIFHFANLDAIGDANTYYTAAVKSMLQSWHNFFFAAAEPGGSVTVDKPPLGLWIEAIFAYFLGVSGVTVSLPNMLAGIFSVPLLYHLVRKHLGEMAGLVAALVLAVTPVAIATDRNNTMDGMLVFTLLLAAWAFIKATESSKLRWLLLGGFILGLGFNIKMLQAFLPLPAFYALYFFGAKTNWWKKTFSLGLATTLMLVVSLSWAVAVDLTPADQRPYIGSSEDNTVMELIIGHNGLSRLFGHGGGNRAQTPSASDEGVPNPVPYNPGNRSLQGSPPEALAACEDMTQGKSCSFTLPNGHTVSGACILPLNSANLACAPQGNDRPQNGRLPAQGIGRPDGPPSGGFGDGPNASPDGPQNTGGTPFSNETGSPGLTRFFVSPLSKQMSWLLPFALVSIALLVLAARVRWPLKAEHRALVLWGGWLLTCLVFFSAVEGIFHAYYAIMLAPALGGVVGGGFAQLWRKQTGSPVWGAVLVLASLVTIGFQVFAARQNGLSAAWLWLPFLPILPGVGLLLWERSRPVGNLTLLASMLLIPLIWTGMTVFDATPEVNLPSAFGSGRARQERPLNEPNDADKALLTYLQAHTQDVDYLVAVPNAHTGSPLVLSTGRPVLYMGGFGGGDPVIDADGLAEMVSNGELRYVYFGGGNGKQDIANWLKTSCVVVPEFSQGAGYPGQAPPLRPDDGNDGPHPDNGGMALFMCG